MVPVALESEIVPSRSAEYSHKIVRTLELPEGINVDDSQAHTDARRGTLAFRFIVGTLAGVIVLFPATAPLADDASDHFERHIRPVLVTHCLACHAGAAPKGGLRLDWRGGWQTGGDSGPAVVPRKPDASLLLQALRYDGLMMPPSKKLPGEVVAHFETWIRSGAFDPRQTLPAQTKPAEPSWDERFAVRSQWWSFRPVTAPAIPTVRDTTWSRHPVDRFVQAKLEASGLTPSPEADRAVLLRRVTYDLIGLPATYEETQAFLADASPDAWSNTIDRLLSRPEYGQRWGRHWLDVARYADTIEQSVDGERRIPFAHTYRDYVIDAFNNDTRFDRFVLQQIAADRLPDATIAEQRGLGFFGVGRQFRSNAEGPALRVDDRIDTVTRGFLGLTVSCARCHDHKFDAVSTRDYYSLYGILDSLEQPLDLPALSHTGRSKSATESNNETNSKEPAPSKEVAEYLASREKAIAAYEAHVDACVTSSNQHLRDFATEYLQYVVRASPNHRTTSGDIPLDTPKGWLVYHAPDRWAALLKQCQQRDEPFFRLWHQLMALPQQGFAEGAERVIANGLDGHHPVVVEAFSRSKPKSMLDVASTYGELIAKALKSPGSDIVELVFGKSSPVPPRDRDEIREDLHRFLNEKQLVNRSDGEKASKLRGDLDLIEIKGPIDRALIVKPTRTPTNPRVFVRGDLRQPGEAVPRRFLKVLAMVDNGTYADDGRLQLARAVAHPQNPLTARVIVNRVWQHHFGTGLVATPDDFGRHGEPPSHPELLDHLAHWFMEHGWSLKALHRYLLTSATWKQSGRPHARGLAVDPDNRLLWRMAPRRLEFEPLRDGMLFVAGRLDTRFGGRGELLTDTNRRRAVYGFTDRFRIPALLRNFDVANPDSSIARRTETVIPLQALYLMNSPFSQGCAKGVLERPAITSSPDLEKRLTVLFRIVLARDPTADEIAWSRDVLAQQPGDAGWLTLTHGLLLTNEFVYID